MNLGTCTGNFIPAFSLALALSLVGCASAPDKVSASYVSPIMYRGLECDQLQTELMRVSTKVSQVSSSQEKNAQRDAAAVAVGLVLFWPALFFLAGEDQAQELANLKGQYEALEQASIIKRCDFVPELMEAKREMEARKLAKLEAAKDDEDDISRAMGY